MRWFRDRHGHYGANQCVTDKIDNYLINGVLPPSRSVCAAAPRPQVPADSARVDTKEARIRAATGQTSVWR